MLGLCRSASNASAGVQLTGCDSGSACSNLSRPAGRFASGKRSGTSSMSIARGRSQTTSPPSRTTMRPVSVITPMRSEWRSQRSNHSWMAPTWVRGTTSSIRSCDSLSITSYAFIPCSRRETLSTSRSMPQPPRWASSAVLLVSPAAPRSCMATMRGSPASSRHASMSSFSMKGLPTCTAGRRCSLASLSSTDAKVAPWMPSRPVSAPTSMTTLPSRLALARARGGTGGGEDPERAKRRARQRAHGEDVAEDAADTGRRTLVRLDRAGVVVRLYLEHRGATVADVDGAGVPTGALEHALAGGGEAFQQWLAGLVAAVLTPERADDAELDARRRAPQLGHGQLVLVGGESNLRQLGGRDHGYAHATPAKLPCCPTSAATQVNSCRPSALPSRLSTARSGWGIMPSTLRPSLRMPAMSRIDPLGVASPTGEPSAATYRKAMRSSISSVSRVESSATKRPSPWETGMRRI